MGTGIRACIAVGAAIVGGAAIAVEGGIDAASRVSRVEDGNVEAGAPAARAPVSVDADGGVAFVSAEAAAVRGCMSVEAT